MTRSEFRLVPTAALTIALTATAATDPHGTFTLKLQPSMILGFPAQWRGSDAPRTLLGDSLSRRYDAARLAPYDASRRQMHRLMLNAPVKCAGWAEPAVNLGIDGQLEMQWWRGNKSLTLIIDGDRTSFLQAWGEDVQAEMADGEVGDADAFLALWSWLQE